MRKAGLISGGLLFLIAVFFAWNSIRLPVNIPGAGLGPGMFPLAIAIILGTLSIFLLYLNLLPPVELFNDEDFQISRQEFMGVGVVFITQTIYILSIPYLGFGTSTFLFASFLTNLLGKYAWWKCGAFGLSVSFIVIQVFREMLGLPLMPGLTGF